MQIVLLKIWTYVSMSISYDGINYTTNAAQKYQIFLYSVFFFFSVNYILFYFKCKF